jgi:N-acetylneuraminic acid mutarotase
MYLPNSMKSFLIIAFAVLFVASPGVLHAQVPQLINYQGRVGVDGVNFDGSGQFKFAFVNAAGTTTYWSNDNSSTAGSEPATAVGIPVSKGLYSILLGDATQAHMSIVPATVFTNGDVHLRVWFSDGVKGFQQLTPDRRIAAVGYALMADSVSDGAITTAKLADGAVTSEKLAAGVVQTSNLATGAVGNAQLANSALTINAGTGLSGGGLVSLGGNVTLSNSGVLSLSSGGGITVDTATGVVTLGSSATSANTASAIVARDASGNFTAGTITAALNGNATTATDATNFTGMLSGDVTGTQSATAIAVTTVTGKALTGFTSASGTLTASDTLLSAISKLDGNAALKAPLTSPTFTGSVTLPAGSATTVPLRLQTGTSLTTPAFGAVEFDGTNVFVTNNSASPTRKTVAFTDTPLVNAQIADGSVTAAKLAVGAVGSAQLAPGAALANLNSAGQSGVVSGGVLLATGPNESLANAGYLNVGTMLVNTNAPSSRNNFTTIWTGAEMIVWGGTGTNPLGSRFAMSTNNWVPTTETNAPAKRTYHSAVWTGIEMIVWGGNDVSVYYGNGGRYDPASNTWLSVSDAAAPSSRTAHTAVWTGTEMIVWGGVVSNGSFTNDGGRYNPSTNTWSAISTASAPTARSEHKAVWTGTEMIVWGGVAAGNNTANTGGRYNPSTNTWQSVATVGAPTARYQHCAVWTGSELIVWGGFNNLNSTYQDNGSRYNPASNTWAILPDGPAGRAQFSAIWTGTKMIVWGGAPNKYNTGSIYDPFLDAWTVLPTANAPAGRYGHTAVWTGTDMIIWGGPDYSDGGFYKVTTNDWLPLPSERTFFIYQKP